MIHTTQLKVETEGLYYNVNAVPDFIIDGNVWQGNSSSVTNAQIDAVMANPAFVSLSSYHVVNGQTVDFTVTINPLGDFQGPLTLYSAVFEYMTYNNIGSNGETQFSHVMKKMVPGSMGFNLGSLTDGQTVVEISLTHSKVLTPFLQMRITL